MSLHRLGYPRAHRGYQLQRQLDGILSVDDVPYVGWSIVSPLPGPDGTTPPVPSSWVPFPSVGGERLYVSPLTDERALPARFIQPLVCSRRGQPESGVGYIGVNSRVCTREHHLAAPLRSPSRPLGRQEQLEVGLPRPRLSVEELLHALHLPSPPPPALAWDGQPRAPVRVAIIDADCGGWRRLRGVDEDAMRLSAGGKWMEFPRSQQPPDPMQPIAGHGVVMAAAVEAVAPGVRLGLFEVPFTHASYVHATDLAAGLARAVGAWEADVVLVAMAHGAWGTPAHLRAILRGCARQGRGGRGAIIVCCTGRIDQNRDREGDSAALASDDFNAQPWLIPVAACGAQGGWYRVHHHPLGRLGPSVELCAPGDLVTFPGVGAADDSSLAAALVAGTAARMVATHPGLSLGEVRQLLRATALDVPAELDRSHGSFEGDFFNDWDRAGHNFKLGYGKVDAQGACLAAADPICFALLTTRRSQSTDLPLSVSGWELEAARSWESLLQRLSSRSERIQRYLALRGHLIPVVLRAPALQDSLFWLARHLRALHLHGPPGWQDEETDQGALSDRCLHALEVLGEVVEGTPAQTTAKEIREWQSELIVHIETTPPRSISRFLAKGFACSALASD